jgi:hypothetical protein
MVRSLEVRVDGLASPGGRWVAVVVHHVYGPEDVIVLGRWHLHCPRLSRINIARNRLGGTGPDRSKPFSLLTGDCSGLPFTDNGDEGRASQSAI